MVLDMPSFSLNFVHILIELNIYICLYYIKQRWSKFIMHVLWSHHISLPPCWLFHSLNTCFTQTQYTWLIYMHCKIIYSAWNNKLDFAIYTIFFNNVLLHIYSQETYDHQVEIYNFLFLGSPVSCIVLYPVCKHFK